MGDEAELRTVIWPDAVALTVRQAEARREAMIAKWDHNGWLTERAARPAASRGTRDQDHEHEHESTAA
jgi:hypothetical protein